MIRRRIQQVMIDPDGLQIGYYTPAEDTKQPGIALVHTLIVPKGADYDDEIQAVLDALEYLVNDVMDDWPRLADMPDPDENPDQDE